MEPAIHRLGQRPAYAPAPAREPAADHAAAAPVPAGERGGAEGIGPEPADLATAALVHDFNNMLSVILGCASELERSLDGAEDRERAGEIRAAGRRGAVLTRRLLAISRGRSAEPVPVDLNGSIAQSREILLRVLGDRIELSCDLEAGLARVMLPPGQVEQVLVNLLANARDAIGPVGGSVSIRTAMRSAGREDGLPAVGWYACMTISDDGRGMGGEEAARAGEPFFTTKGAGGNGLGLAGARNLARLAGGDLRIGTALGQGTRVSILLPAVRVTGEPLTLRRAGLEA